MCIRDRNITAAGFPPEVDEFEKAGLTKEPSVLVKPPRVKESPIQFECKYVQTIRLPGEGRVGTADIIIGKVVGVHIKDEFITEDGKIDILKIKPLARLGYSDYTYVDHSFEIKPSELAGKSPDLAFGLEGATGSMPVSYTHLPASTDANPRFIKKTRIAASSTQKVSIIIVVSMIIPPLQ